MGIESVGCEVNYYGYSAVMQNKSNEIYASECASIGEVSLNSEQDPLEYYKKLCGEYTDIAFRLDDIAEAAKSPDTLTLGYLEGGKMNHISQLLIRQATNGAKGIEDYQNVFGNSVESSLQAAKEVLYELENPLTPVNERGEDAREYIEQENVFYKKFIEKLSEI